MSIVTINEGTAFTRDEWLKRLSVSSADIEFLINTKVLRVTDSGDYSLFFVGIVVFADSLLFAQPKFGSTNQLDLSETLRILRSYFARSSARRPHSDRNRDPEFGDSGVLREFDALMGLREWFFAHGLYRREQAVASNSGRQDWVKTISKGPALFMQGSVIYPSVIAERREGVLNDISALQVGILRQLLQRYGVSVPSAIRHAELAAGTVVCSWPLEPDTRLYYERRLAAERRSVFRTDTLRLFELLHELLDSRLAAPSKQPQIYGTTAFYSIWEDACYTGIGCDLPVEANAAFGQPTWWTEDRAGQKQRHGQTQIPDLVVRRSPWMLIVDAKYYYPFPAARPGGPDIIKQLYYAESLRDPEAKLLSIFILPLPGAVTPAFLGYATIEGSYQAFTSIEAWGIDPATLLCAYPAVSTDRANTVIDTIVNHRRRVSEFISQAPMKISM